MTCSAGIVLTQYNLDVLCYPIRIDGAYDVILVLILTLQIARQLVSARQIVSECLDDPQWKVCMQQYSCKIKETRQSKPMSWTLTTYCLECRESLFSLFRFGQCQKRLCQRTVLGKTPPTKYKSVNH